MADTKISAATAVVTPASTDEYPTNQGGVSKKTTRAQMHDLETGEHLILPADNDAATPSLAWGVGGDTGFYEAGANIIGLSLGGSQIYDFGLGNFVSVNAGGFGLKTGAAAAADPDILPNRADGDTGIGWTAADQLSLIAGGVQVANLTEASAVVQMILPAQNNAAAPSLAFGDGDTGFYELSDDRVRFSAAGTSSWLFDATRIEATTVGGAFLENVAASATNPVHTFSSDTDTGIGAAAADQLSLIAGGKEMLRLTETGTATSDQLIIGPAGVIGAAATPSLAFGDGDTGFYEPSDDVIRLSIAGANKWVFSSAGMGNDTTGNPYILSGAATSTAPGYAFGSDDDTGIGRAAADALSLIAGGVEGIRITEVAGHTSVSTPTLGTSNLKLGVNAGDAIASGGNYNVLVGDEAGTAITIGDNNVAVGYQAADAVTEGGLNIAIGLTALGTDTKGSKSTAVGAHALATANQTSAVDTFNTAIGYNAGGGVTDGVQNTLIGGLCHDNLTEGNLNISVGYDNAPSAVDVDSEIVIGNSITGAGTNTVRIGTAGGTATLGLDGSDTSWAAASDSRLKKDVAESTAGLKFINDLRPVTFKWNAKNEVAEDLPQYDADSSDPIFGEGKAHHGFIAQEVKAVIDDHSDVLDGNNIWHEDPDGTQQMSQGNLVPMLVKAIQEQNTLIESLTTRITTLEGT